MLAWANFWLISTAVLGLIVVVAVRRRSAAMRALAARRGLSYLGPTLPKSFTLKDTSLQRATSFRNVIEGERHGVRMMAFDCRIGAAKNSPWRTVIAANVDEETLRATAVNPELVIESSSNWSIMHQLKTFSLVVPGLMPVSEVEGYLSALSSRTRFGASGQGRSLR